MIPEPARPASPLASFTLGDWLVEPRACHLSRGDTVVKLRPQLVDLLVCLARRHGEIVLKDEILAEVWPGQFIAESGLSRCVAELRQFLQDDVQEPRYIETIPKRGYRLVAPVAWLPPAREAPPRAAAGAGIETAAAGADEPAPGRRVRQLRGTWLAGSALLLAVAVAAVVLGTRTPARVLTERDTVLLAFENHTGDAVFDEAIPLAMAIQLEQSPYLGLLSPGRVEEVLGMMKRPAGTPVTRAVGLEVCERVGGRALIVTSVARLGAQYVIGLEAVECRTGAVLARRQATTDRKERVLGALQQTAGEIRLAVGESTASLERHQQPAVEATTVSLDALRAVRRGDVARERGEVDRALESYREAVALDPEFALAQNRLGLMAIGDEALAAWRKAYALRQGVTLPERLEIEAAYHRYVTGEMARSVEALELLTRSYPRRALARRDLAVEYMTWGRYDAALREALEAQRLEPGSAMNTAAVAKAYLYLNRVAEARQAAEQALAFGSTAVDLHRALFYCAVASGDAALLARERGWAAAHPGVPVLLEDEAEESVRGGRLAEAIGFMKKYEAWGAAAGLPDVVVRTRFRMARYEALCGLRERAASRVEAELQHAMGPIPRIDAVRALVSAGRLDLAEGLLDELERTPRPNQWVATMARTYRASIAASRGRLGEASRLLEPLQPVELAFGYSLEPLLVRAQAHYLAGDWANARAAFEKILAHSTIDSARKILPQAQIGLARALARAGDPAASRREYEVLFAWWKEADAGLPLLREARREYEALPPP